MHKRLIQSKRGGAFVNNIRENQNKCDTLAKEIKWIFVRDRKKTSIMWLLVRDKIENKFWMGCFDNSQNITLTWLSIFNILLTVQLCIITN